MVVAVIAPLLIVCDVIAFVLMAVVVIVAVALIVLTVIIPLPAFILLF